MPSPKQIETAGELLKGVAEKVAPELAAQAEARLSHEAATLLREGAQLAQKSGATSLLDRSTRQLIDRAAATTGDQFPSIILDAAKKSGIPASVDVGKIEEVRAALDSGDEPATSVALHKAFSPRSYGDYQRFFGH